MAEDPAHGGDVAKARSSAFRERARLEADRYGPDPWVFVRELLQNSRDAGARNVTFLVRDDDGRELVVCRDDGEGMSFEHARRYLFSLYASSKEGEHNQAGKFGVGFWSILRFEPAAITIRSCTRTGERWGLRLDGSLEHATRVKPLETPGTEITLERSGGDGRLEHRVFDAVWQSARYLHRRDDADAPLPVTVNGRSANAEFALPAPSATFRRGSVRGVVGLGPAPRVELFSRGLRVRSAASLEDLIAPAGRHTARMRVQFPELPGGLAPQALLESDKLEVMLSRSDARDNRALGRLVKLAQKELQRLIHHQLSHARPQPWWRTGVERMVELFRESLAVRTVTGALTGAMLAIVVAGLLWGDRITTEPRNEVVEAPTPVAVGSPPPAMRPYQDLGVRYGGPKVDVLSPGAAEPIPLRYRPPDQRLYFAALTFSRLTPDGSPAVHPSAEKLESYEAISCDRECFEVELPIDAQPGATRLPTPTGHRVAAGSVTLDGHPLEVRSAGGHPSVWFQTEAKGLLSFRTAAAPDPSAKARLRVSSALPEDLVAFSVGLRRQPVEVRVERLLERVRERVAYDRTQEIAQRHSDAVQRGHGFIERTLEIGAGDCDVQNGLLVAMMHAANIEARLAVGYIGARGGVLPWLHAWVEYRDERGRWQVADASESSNQALPPLLADADPPEVQPVTVPGLPAKPLSTDTPPVDTPPKGSDPPQATDPASDDDAVAAATKPASTRSTTPGTDDGGALQWVGNLDERFPWAVRGLPILLLALAGASLTGARTRRALKLDQGADLSRLLQGVLQQPGAFGNVQALFTRPLVPLIDGDAISLNRARDLASIGRLYCTQRQPPLAKRAVKVGAAVVDLGQPEGRTVADALGAVDLDRWASWLEQSRADALTADVNESLRARGEDWGIRIGRGLVGDLAVLDLGPLGARVPGLRAPRVVLIDERARWLAQALALRERNPKAAAFLVLDGVTERLDLPTDRRARLLSEGARQALLEGFAGSSS